VKNSPKILPKPLLCRNEYTTFTTKNSSTKILATSAIFKKTHKINSRPMSVKSPNLVTLLGNQECHEKIRYLGIKILFPGKINDGQVSLSARLKNKVNTGDSNQNQWITIHFCYPRYLDNIRAMR
jgi:hypothetical protein